MAPPNRLAPRPLGKADRSFEKPDLPRIGIENASSRTVLLGVPGRGRSAGVPAAGPLPRVTIAFFWRFSFAGRAERLIRGRRMRLGSVGDLVRDPPECHS
jgi:hypothetical protein